MSKKKKRSKEIAMMRLCITVIVVCIIAVGFVYISTTSFLANSDGGSVWQLSQSLVTPVDVQDKSVNVLIAGIDYLEGTTRGQLTDVIMLANIDIENGKINVMQIPRDTYIGTHISTGKINAVYGMSSNGGIDGLANTVYTLFNIPIDHYVTLNMSGFQKIMESVGDLTVNVPVGFSLDGITIEQGVQTLNAEELEKLVRERYSYANGDLGRMDAQKEVLKALVNRVFEMSKLEIMEQVPVIFENVSTDLNMLKSVEYYQKVMKMEIEAINFYTAPVERGDYFNGHSVVVLDKDAVTDLLNEQFRTHTAKVSVEEIGIPSL